MKDAIEENFKGHAEEKENLILKMKYCMLNEDENKIGHLEVKATNGWNRNIYLKKITLKAGPSDKVGIILSSLLFSPHEKLEDGQEEDYDIGDTTATWRWAEGAWREFRGYPGACAFFQERLVLAGSNSEPQTIWMSQTDDWTHFEVDDLATSALMCTIASDQVNKIFWLSSHKGLIIGTSGAEWILSGTKRDTSLAPGGFAVKRHSNYGRLKSMRRWQK